MLRVWQLALLRPTKADRIMPVILVIGPSDSVRDTLCTALGTDNEVVVRDPGRATGRLAKDASVIAVWHWDWAGRPSMRNWVRGLSTKKYSPAIIVLNAPEPEVEQLYGAGAVAVEGFLFRPVAVALRCVAMCNWVNRRKPHFSTLDLEPFKFGGAKVHPQLRVIEFQGRQRSQPISRLQFKVLKALHRESGELITYKALYRECWGRVYSGNNASIREALSTLRTIFDNGGANFNDWVQTKYSGGYTYQPTGAASAG